MPGVRLSPKHGVNPTLPVCFWCGKERGDIALLGRIGGKQDLEAPRNAVVDYRPCRRCCGIMNAGLTLMEATPSPNYVTSVPAQSGVYPTGRWSVVTAEAADRIFGPGTSASKKAFVDPETYELLFRDVSAS